MAGTASGGGGTGIVYQGKLIVLDLAEAGAAEDPYLPDLKPDAGILKALEQNVRASEDFKKEVLLPLAKKLTEIDQVAHPVGLYMATAMGAYELKLVPYQLTLLDDVQSPIAEEKIPIAQRHGSRIFISRPQWQRLDIVNKVALLTHEIIYAFQPSADGADNPTVKQILKTSVKARFMNGYLYLRDWRQSWSNRMREELTVGNKNSAYNYLFGAMIANIGNRTRVTKLETVASGSAKRPKFSALHVQGNLGVLKRDSTFREMLAMCKKGLVWPGHPYDYGYEAAEVRHEEMRFHLGKVILNGIRNEIVIVSPPKRESACARLVAKQQKLWLP